MCQKSNIMKQFFVLFHHPPPLQKPLVMTVLRQNPTTLTIFEETRNSTYLSKKQFERLGVPPPRTPHAYLVPIQIPNDWFLH